MMKLADKVDKAEQKKKDDGSPLCLNNEDFVLNDTTAKADEKRAGKHFKNKGVIQTKVVGPLNQQDKLKGIIGEELDKFSETKEFVQGIHP